jgi:hypothetical protein
MVNVGKTKVLIFNASKFSLMDLHFHYKGTKIEITTTYAYLGVQFTGPVLACDMPLCPRSVKGMIPWSSLRDNASWVSFRTSHPNSTSWRQLLDPQFSMAQRSRSRSCYRHIGPGWRGSTPCFSGVSSTASGRFHNPLSRQSLVSTHSSLRSFSAWFFSFLELDLFVTLPSGESGSLT